MITNPEIDRYLQSLQPTRDAVLSEMEATAAKRKIPIIGPVVARFLAQLVMISGAKRIFELGSAIGYSTIWLARAAGPSAQVYYTDGSAENAREARGYIERAGVETLVQVNVGDALTVLRDTPGEFDFIFNDVDKEGYPAVLEAVPSRLKTGGLFVTDNTLWHESVLNPQDDVARAVVEFNQKLYRSEAFFTTTVPMRDGISVAVKR
jgi:caffeoyl-CoA O-methyltransferase